MDELKVTLEELKEDLQSGSHQAGANPLEAPSARRTKPQTAIIAALALVNRGNTGVDRLPPVERSAELRGETFREVSPATDEVR